MDRWDQQQKYIELVAHRSEEQELRTGKKPTAYCRTFGCQQNVSDGEKINGMLWEMGYTPCDSPAGADVVIYNTCAVRENAEDRIFGNVGALKLAKKQHPGMVVALCGCMMQQEHIADKIKKSYPYVDLIFGTHALPRLPELLYRRFSGGGRVVEVECEQGEIVEDLPIRRDGEIKAWLPIMYGCDNFCTYCVVPFVRGRERSREPERIVAEARELIAQGYKEITLLGQNVNSYGKNLPEPMNFSQLLEKICGIEGEFRLRFMTSHPKDCTRELIDTIAAQPKICRSIHLPVQSGSDRVLRAMNRRYTSGDYRELVRYAREKIPGISFTSDMIVGFPGETGEDFQETLKLVEDVGYQSLFTFVYSPRQGTKAVEMDDPIPHEEKMRWFQQLLDTQRALGRGHHDRLVGETVRVLAEGPGKSGPGYLTGRTSGNIIAEFQASTDQIGQFVDVKITKALNWAVVGEL